LGEHTLGHSAKIAAALFDHVTIRASDREASERFYKTVLSPLGIDQTYGDEHFVEWDDFSLSAATEDKPVTRRLHIAFTAPSWGDVDEFWRVGTDAGYRDDGAPGLRAQYSDDYYGAFLLDPDGNSAEAVHHGGVSSGVDHFWIRVADVAASKRFYEAVALHAGFRLKHDSPDRAQFVGAQGSFSVVAGEPTQHVHIAFPVDRNSMVDEFHRALTEAGYRDNGPPGERPIYHAGYYGAFVLDPDGNNVELVNHNRS
jgi:catechol 2,3-dioxygenase-like lactoylglutathione lyase family enzyme